ncbi:MAG: 16S rRNA (cytosine(967)-C(5))-methyltransferase RsmB [Clostridiales bacterium]|nr:16S rRNA (cytosine(967)-C(5))-methyltransferase RsmB [Clostridiales bacterium]
MIKSARLTAFETLYKIFYDNAYSNIALDKALSDIDGEKAFVSALVYGVVERKITLDYFIDKYVSSKLKPKIRIILRLGAYQLLFMDKVPSSAAINESVNLVKEIKQDYYSKMVNAVLHKIDNDRKFPDDLSVEYSVPKNLISMWSKQYSLETVKSFLPYINGRPPVFAVANTLYVDADELSYELLSENVDCEVTGELVKINSGFDLNKLKSFKNGLFHIEDMSCYECVKAMNVCENDLVLDLCAAPGGKTFTIAEMMNNTGKIYALDLYKNRVNLIKKGAERLGLTSVITDVNDATVFNSELPKFDKVLCDVPCSGFGIIRRKPEVRYKELDSIKDLPETQLAILENGAKYLKENGMLIYSTCTLNKKENEQVTSAFLNNDKDFKLKYEKTCFPSENGGDGFYHAVMSR